MTDIQHSILHALTVGHVLTYCETGNYCGWKWPNGRPEGVSIYFSNSVQALWRRKWIVKVEYLENFRTRYEISEFGRQVLARNQ